MIEVDLTVVGGGIVGCAVAAEAAGRGLRTVLLERESRLATGVTSRNSEVAHGGMYYPTGSLKARCCVRGRRRLRELCLAHRLPLRECGKLIVAVAAGEEPELERLLELGRLNGVEELALLSRREVRALEPRIEARAALHSPRTFVLSAEATARAYGRLAAERGAEVLTGAPVRGLERAGDGWLVSVGGAGPAGGGEAGRAAGREGWRHRSRLVVNAAGLQADEVAALAGLDPDAEGLRQVWVKGNYFAVAARHAGRVGRLVYPVPPADHTSLGVHLCLDTAGGLRLGPDVEQVPDRARADYTVDPARRSRFHAGAARFLPFLREDDLEPAWAGLRPRRSARGFRDFLVRFESGDRAGLVNLIGIDSPGLTSAPALAELVCDGLPA